MHSLTSRLDPRPHPEERARRKGAAESNGRARVSKDEDERLYSALMLRDASQRLSAVDTIAFASRCDAPQHEGEGRPATCACDGRGSIVSALLFTMKIPTCACR